MPEAMIFCPCCQSTLLPQEADGYDCGNCEQFFWLTNQETDPPHSDDSEAAVLFCPRCCHPNDVKGGFAHTCEECSESFYAAVDIERQAEFSIV